METSDVVEAEYAVVAVGEDDLATKANRVNELQDMIIHSAQNMVQYAIEIGNILIDVKASLGHGEWLPWVMANLNFKYTKAQTYMKLALANSRSSVNFDEVSSIDQALNLIATPKQPKLPANTETRMLRKENEFGFPEYEVDMLPDEEKVERSTWETQLVNRNPEKNIEIETHTFVDELGNEHTWNYNSKDVVTDSVRKLAEAFSTIDEVFVDLTNIEDPEVKAQAAYYLNAIVSGLTYRADMVTNWSGRCPNYKQGDYKPYSARLDDPIQRAKEEAKPKYQTVM